MKENGHISKILIGRKAIMDYLDLKSKDSFYKWIKRGMPAMVEENRWYAHKENLENFFKVRTNIILSGEIPEDAD
jgi:hypothetical protein